jgi:hypothetical protein
MISDIFALNPDRFRVLRVGRDWQEIQFYGLQQQVWSNDAYFEDDEYKREVAICENVLSFRLVHIGKRPALRCQGWAIMALEHAPDGIPSCTIQVQGVAWAGQPDLLLALDELEGWLTGGLMGHLRKPGRTDLCADIWISDGVPDPLAFVEALTLSTLEDWRTHLRKTDQQWRIVKDGRGLSTLYIGARARLQVRIYRKDSEFRGSTAPAFVPLWTSLGWDGTGAIVRVEFEIHRAWLRDHRVGHRRLSQLTFAEWEKMLPGIWLSVLDLISFCPGDGRKARRPESALWTALRVAPFEGRACDPVVVRSAVRERNEDDLHDRLNRSIWASQEAFGDRVVGQMICVARAPPPELASEKMDWKKRSPWANHLTRKEKEEDVRKHGREEAERREREEEARIEKAEAEGNDPR